MMSDSENSQQDTDQSSSEPQKSRRGIYLLPNMITTAGLFSGFYAIVAGMDGRFESAAVAIFIAMILDGLDGRVARLTHTQSDFGVEYDSLSDMVCFGLAPALVVYEWSLKSMVSVGWAKLGWLAAFIYTASAALRLARFNSQVATAEKAYFRGLPSPSAAGVLAGMVWAATDFGLKGDDLVPVAFVLSISMGLLMVSNIRYYSFKEFNFKNRVPFVAVLIVMLVYAFASIDPPKVLFVAFLCYAIFGIIYTLVGIRKRRRARKRGE